MKNPNGYGTVYKIKGRNLRKPWKAVVTLKWVMQDGKAVQKRRGIGYFATRTEAMKALANYSGNVDEILTVGEIYGRYWAERVKELSESSVKTYVSVSHYIEPIFNRKIVDIRTKDLDALAAPVPASRQVSFRTLLHGIYAYALRYELIDKDYSQHMAHAERPQRQIERAPFSGEEITKLFEDGSQIANSVLVAIYSGWRWNELMSFELDGDIMVGGSKTEAGKGRRVPVHHKIAPLIGNMYRTSAYSSFRRAFTTLMERLGMNHTIHDTRHTTATLLDENHADRLCTKLILGHAVTDITEAVYIHKTDDDLREAIECIP